MFLKATMTKTEFHVDEEVLIVKGDYKKYGRGIYKGPVGSCMAYVQVLGDSRDTRRLYLTSLKRPKKARSAANAKTDSSDKITIDKREYDELVSNVQLVQECVEELRERIRALTLTK